MIFCLWFHWCSVLQLYQHKFHISHKKDIKKSAFCINMTKSAYNVDAAKNFEKNLAKMLDKSALCVYNY